MVIPRSQKLCSTGGKKEAMLGMLLCGVEALLPRKKTSTRSSHAPRHGTGNPPQHGQSAPALMPTVVLRIVTTGNTDYVKSRVARLGSDGWPII